MITVKEKKQKQVKIAFEIINKVNKYYGTDVRNLSRKKEFVYPRFLAIILIYDICDVLTLEFIGTIFKQHHSNMIHARNKARDILDVDSSFREDYQALFFEIDEEIKVNNRDYYNKVEKMKSINRINNKLRKMDLVLLNNINENLNLWKRSNGNV